MLLPISEVEKKIAARKALLLAGSEKALAALSPGSWIAGSIPYFMDVDGGVCSETKIFVTEIPEYARGVEIRRYTPETLPGICHDGPENGFTFVIMPAGSPVHLAYACGAPLYRDIFFKPVVGWIAGVHLSRLGQDRAKTFDGTGCSFPDLAI